MKSVYHIVVGFLMRKISKAIEASGKPALEKPDIIPIDGKVSTSSARRQASQQEAVKPVNMLNAYSSNWDMCLDQEYIEKKSNEIPAAPILLNRMDLNGAIVTADALNTQTKTAEAIIAQGGKYVLAVKGSKKYLYQGIVEYFDPKRRIGIKENPKIGESYHRTIEKEHDSLVIREYYLTTDTSNVYKREEWPEATEIGLVRRTVVNLQYNSQIHEEFRYYICGGTIGIEDFTRSTRLHWGVENNLHWQLDYIFKDDANRTMADTGAEGLQLFKKASMAILKASKVLYPHYYSMNNIRSLLNQNFEGNIGKILSILTIDNILEANMKRR
jgi:predicted transposase YbfD/YdcC